MRHPTRRRQAGDPSLAWAVGCLEGPGFRIHTGVHAAASVLMRHEHDLPTICAVEQGSFTEYYPGKAVACGEGTLKVTPAGEPHWNRFDGVTTYGMRIDVDPERFSGQSRVERMLAERLFLSAGSLGSLTREIAAEVNAADSVSSVAAEGLLLELLAKMARMLELPEQSIPQWLRRADEMVHELYLGPLTVAGVAAEVGVHGSTLSRAYRRTFGVTLARRIRDLRLEHAARRLTATSAPLTEIALDAGFYDQSHFTNAFRRHMGATPARYRQQHGGSASRQVL
jgi:AraC family transcriptional regulator